MIKHITWNKCKNQESKMGPHEGIIYSEIADYNKFEE